MNQLHCWISSFGLLLCLTVCTCSPMNIWRIEGQDVTIPCRYNSHYHGTCDVCWMRGSIPRSGCGNQIIYATGKNVVMRGNRRYQLNGNLQKGDASLTILNARISDSGKYGCRIHVPGWFNDIKMEVYLIITEAPKPSTTLRHITTTTRVPTHGPVLTTQDDISTVPEHVTTSHTGPVLTTQDDISTVPEHVTTSHTGPDLTTQDETTTAHEIVTTKHTGPVLTTQDDISTVPEHVTTSHTETQQTFTTLEYVTTTTHIPTQRPDLTTQDETTTAHEIVTTKHTETQQTTSTLGYVTTVTHIPTQGPVLTTQDETSTAPEHVTTKHTGPVLTTQDDISTVPEHVTTSHTGPDLTTQDETTTAHEIVTTKHTETQQTTSTLGYVTTVTHIPTQGPVLTTQDETSTAPEHVTTKHTVVIAENDIDVSSSEKEMLVNEDPGVLPAILVPVILILAVLGISAVYFISKQKRRFRSTIELAKNSSVNYNNLDSSVTLPITNLFNN
ncbi:hepatitis A virus cellular receptor 1 isoform X16 [Ictalurus punctatus]|uniref:Hepatitis A virus cellular receptor 1 isoform X16 n=1 Tax=Ictalurus punctatus TaxID=7998 RepID=A0A2D0PZF1_ICTPU|nr:hepatitis A virus cellular receptor 1 isoform X16 [Ictalurus punctatus]